MHSYVFASFPLAAHSSGGGEAGCGSSGRKKQKTERGAEREGTEVRLEQAKKALWAIALNRDGTLPGAGAAVAESSPQRVAARKEHYHHPRCLMLCTELIDALLS